MKFCSAVLGSALLALLKLRIASKFVSGWAFQGRRLIKTAWLDVLWRLLLFSAAFQREGGGPGGYFPVAFRMSLEET